MKELRTMEQQYKHFTKDEYETLRYLSHIAKNLVNEVLYIKRQHFFNTDKYLSAKETYHQIKTSINFDILNHGIAENVLSNVEEEFRSFFELNRLYNAGNLYFKPCIPKYLDKDGFTTLVMNTGQMGYVWHSSLKKHKDFKVPFSKEFTKDHKEIRIKVPACLLDKKIKEIRIIPKYNARFFVIQYVYEIDIPEPKKLNNNKALAIDLGVSNFATCVTSNGDSFIIDGKLLKSWNQWYNKRIAELKSVRDHQKLERKYTKKMIKTAVKRNNRMRDYLHKASKRIVEYCVTHDIGKIVLGYIEGFKQFINIGNVNNQNFVMLPFGQFKNYLTYKCANAGIELILQEESYTSKASFIDDDTIPVYITGNNINYTFSGKRKGRNYVTKDGKIVNSDANGAFNILSKSKTVSFNRKVCISGLLNGPVRKRLADLNQSQTSY